MLASIGAGQAMRNYPLPTILIVDDEPLQRFLIREILSEDPTLHFLEALDDRQAFRLIQLHDPSAIILDLGGPSLRGLHLYRQLQASFVGRHLPIIFTATWLPTDSTVMMLHPSGYPVFFKPFEVAKLQAAIRHMLERSRQPVEYPVLSFRNGLTGQPSTSRSDPV